MYAIIKTGGKQYRVSLNSSFETERTGAAEGDEIEFSDVLMVSDGENVHLGTPVVAGAKVVGTVKTLTRGDKVIIFKKRRRHHYRRKNGHRQDLMKVEISHISVV